MPSNPIIAARTEAARVVVTKDMSLSRPAGAKTNVRPLRPSRFVDTQEPGVGAHESGKSRKSACAPGAQSGPKSDGESHERVIDVNDSRGAGCGCGEEVVEVIVPDAKLTVPLDLVPFPLNAAFG